MSRFPRLDPDSAFSHSPLLVENLAQLFNPEVLSFQTNCDFNVQDILNMGTTKLHRKKLCVLLILFVLFNFLLVWRATELFCPHGIHNSNRSDSLARFLSTEEGLFKNRQSVKRTSRGFWEGDGLSQYHTWHYGSGLTSRLVTFFRSEEANTILDLGAGAGLHVQELVKQGFFASCYDGSLESQAMSEGRCASMDLTKPVYIAKYDWVLSLSVGRQIPVFLEAQFLANIHNSNSKGVVMYWGDGKRARIDKHLTNIKNNSEVVQIFEGLGYEVNEKTTRAVQGGRVKDVNYSVQVFRKKIEEELSPDQVAEKIYGWKPDMTGMHSHPEVRSEPDCITIALTSCGLDKLEEAVTLVKSVNLFSQHAKLQVIILVDEENIDHLKSKMQILSQDSIRFNPNFKYVVLPTTFPPELEGMSSWKQVFKPCSTQKLFLPTILPSLDALIYLDTDSLILANLTELWHHFSTMGPKVYIGLSEMTEHPAPSWYKLENYPHPGVSGVNTGVALMNLTRMRSQGFVKQIIKVRRQYEYLRPESTGDQFLQNVLFSFSPESVETIPCEWNFRPNHCHCQQYKNATVCGSCRSAMKDGVGIFHGTGDAFSDENSFPLFKSFYKVFQQHNLSQDGISKFMEELVIKFEENENKCFFKDSSTFLKRMANYASKLKLH